MGYPGPRPTPPPRPIDPCPSSPAPPRGGESTEDYLERCGPFVRVNGSYYQKSYVEWRIRQTARDEEAKARAPKKVYTLNPRIDWFRVGAWLTAGIVSAATIAAVAGI